MRYVVSSAMLCGRLQNLERVILAKNNISILSCFLFDVKSDKILLTASDGEVVMRTEVGLIEYSQECKFAINAKRFMEILKEIPEQPLTLDFNPNTYQLDLNFQNGHFALQGEAADDFPLPKEPEGDPVEVKFEASVFSKGLTSAAVAIPNNSSRRSMLGVYFDFLEDKISLVSSDGRKLVCYSILTPIGCEQAGFVLPQKPAGLLKNVAEKTKGEVVLKAYSTSNAIITTDEYEIRCCLINDPYPDYKRIIPQHNDNVAIVDRMALMSAMRRVLVLADKVSSLIKFQFESGKVVLTTEDVNYAQRAEEQLICQYEGAPVKVGFNGANMLELLNNIQSTELTIKLADGTKAGLLLPSEQQENVNLIMLLMPLVING